MRVPKGLLMVLLCQAARHCAMIKLAKLLRYSLLQGSLNNAAPLSTLCTWHLSC